jgi:hypothetical protein
MFYNARWYDSSLGRFAQADSIIPGGVQGYDRYAYTSNNPLRYIDPSGHLPCQYYAGNGCTTAPMPTAKQELESYGITLDGGDPSTNWTIERKLAVLTAARLVGGKFAKERGNGETSAEAFSSVYGGININWGGTGSMGDCSKTTSGGCTSTSHQINFWSMAGQNTDPMQPYRTVKNVVHEFGHAFDKSLGYYDPKGHWIQESTHMPDNVYYNGVRDQVLRSNMANGELSPNHYDWQQHPPSMDALGSSRSETFSDIFVAWTYDAWNTDPTYSNNINDVRNYMNGLVP